MVEQGSFSGHSQGSPLTVDLGFPICKVGGGHLVALSLRFQAEVVPPLGILPGPRRLGQRPP